MDVCALAVIAIGTACLLSAEDEAGQKFPVVKTERMDLPAGGVVHVLHSRGELVVEGWDRPEVEITTKKSPPLKYDSQWREKPSHERELQEVRVTMERHGEEVVITTTLPRRRTFPPPSPLSSPTHVVLEYQIKVPRDAKLTVEHEGGEVHVEDVAGDIQVTAVAGPITLRLPQDGQYVIDAKCDVGTVVSDFPGSTRRRPWLLGHRFVPEATASGHKLYVRAGAGDITILKIRKPAAPGPVSFPEHPRP